MAEATIPVDVTNPGQVFACLGFMEAAEILLGDAEGGFDWSDPGATRFRLSAAGAADPVAEVLAFLGEAEVRAATADGADLAVSKKIVIPHVAGYPDGAYPGADPTARDRVPAVLSARGRSIVIDHWADETRVDAVKFWAGAGGYPGAAMTLDALALLPREMDNIRPDPFNYAAEQSSSFRFDWRRDYIPVDAGFSPNKHGHVVMVGFPVVELLAAIGLSHARPDRLSRLEYLYSAWGTLLALPLACACLGAGAPPWPGAEVRTFRMKLGWPGQEGQARCIVRVEEETEA